MILIIAGVAVGYVALVLFTFAMIYFANGCDGNPLHMLAYSALLWLSVAAVGGLFVLAGFLVFQGLQ